MGMGKSSSAAPVQETPTVTPAIAKDADIAHAMGSQQQQERSLRRGIASTYTRFGQMQAVSDSTNGAKRTLG